MRQDSRLSRFVPKLLPALLCAALATAAFAHDTWLVAQRSTVPTGGSVTLDLTSGMAFPALDYAIKPDRVARASVRLAGKTSQIKGRKSAAHSLRFSAPLAETGIATVWVELAPKSLDLTSPQVKEYLDEIGASPEIRRAYETAPEPRRWREVYAKHAKTFVRVGQPQEDRSWAEPVGMDLEIVPEKDPSTLHAGDELPVLVIRQGKPAASFPVGLVREGDAHGTLKATDAAGRVTFRLDRASRWMLRGTDLRRSTKPATDWESDFTTLTLVVQTIR
ncbi:MAG TPA: DUF4198 domain-containing protein [Thermoanaerobaculia bacterium]|nr:DUF4198 domain-containing protein [Thermoanaerobaculia bacterium]